MMAFVSKHKTALAFAVLLIAFALTQFYIFSDLFIAEFHSDSTDTLIWARASYDSLKIVNPDYGYGYVLPFGGDKLMLPLIPIFGTGITTIRVAMCLFSAILAFTMTRFFRALKWRNCSSFAATSAIFMFFTFSKKLREVYFAHVIHYSLAVLLLMSLIIIFAKFVEAESGSSARKSRVSFAFLALLTFLTSTDGPAVIMFSSAAFTAGIAFESLITERSVKKAWRKRGVKCLILLLAIALGYIVCKYLESLVSNVYTDLTLAKNIPASVLGRYKDIIKSWFVLLGYNGVFSNFGAIARNLAIIGFGSSVVAIFAASPFMLKKMSVPERVFVCAAYFICFECAIVSLYNKALTVTWRLSPFVFLFSAVAFITLRHVFLSSGKRAIAGALIAIYGLCAVYLGASMPLYSRSTDCWYGENRLIDELEKRDLTYGYSTDFWFTNSITAITENEITISKIKLEDGELYKNLLQTGVRWFDDDPSRDKYFLICLKSEAENNPHLYEDALEIFDVEQYDSRQKKWKDLVVSVYDHNIMSGKSVVNY